jgi:hypothetical protein
LACKEIRKKELSIRIASLKFDAPKSASLDRVNYCHGNQIGQPTMLTAEKEALLLEHIQLLAFWGFPFSGQDLYQFIKMYLDKKGTMTRVRDNLTTNKFVA